MGKVVIDKDKVRKLVSEKLKKDGTLVCESKVDKAIKEYLKERKENIDPENAPEQNIFSTKAVETFDDMATSLYNIVEDLMLIQTKEGDVLVEDYPKSKMADEFIDEILNQIELVIESIEHLRDFETEIEEDLYP